MHMTNSTLSCSRQGVAEMEALQQQLAQARMVISHLASQLDHHKDVQNQLAGLSLCTCLSPGLPLLCLHALTLVPNPTEASLHRLG